MRILTSLLSVVVNQQPGAPQSAYGRYVASTHSVVRVPNGTSWRTLILPQTRVTRSQYRKGGRTGAHAQGHGGGRYAEHMHSNDPVHSWPRT